MPWRMTVVERMFEPSRQHQRRNNMDQETAKTEAARIGINARRAGIALSTPDDPKLCELMAACRRNGIAVDAVIALETV